MVVRVKYEMYSTNENKYESHMTSPIRRRLQSHETFSITMGDLSLVPNAPAGR